MRDFCLLLSLSLCGKSDACRLRYKCQIQHRKCRSPDSYLLKLNPFNVTILLYFSKQKTATVSMCAYSLFDCFAPLYYLWFLAFTLYLLLSIETILQWHLNLFEFFSISECMCFRSRKIICGLQLRTRASLFQCTCTMLS